MISNKKGIWWKQRVRDIWIWWQKPICCYAINIIRTIWISHKIRTQSHWVTYWNSIYSTLKFDWMKRNCHILQGFLKSIVSLSLVSTSLRYVIPAESAKIFLPKYILIMIKGSLQCKIKNIISFHWFSFAITWYVLPV